MNTKTCSLPECDKKHVAKGYCNMHYQRIRLHGDPHKSMKGQAHRVETTHDGLRICKGCGIAKPSTDYHADAASPDGLRARCKACRSSHMAKYYEDNREQKVAYERTRRRTQGDYLRAWDKARYQRQRDKRIELAERYGHTRRARMANVAVDEGLTVAKLRAMLGDECCYCGVTMTFKRGRTAEGIAPHRATLEHLLPISRGGSHTFDNADLACHSCNTRKNNKTVDEFMQYMSEAS